MNSRLLVYCALALSLLVLSFCSSGKNEKKEIIRPVRFQEARPSGSIRTRSFSGVAQAGTETNLSFRVNGIVESVLVKVGQKVKQGDPVASLNGDDARLQYEKARAAEKNTRVQMNTAKAHLDRIRGLYENNNVALSEYETTKNNYAAAVSSYESSKRSADLERSQLDYTKLYAPMDGFITRVNVEKNENIQTGSTVAVLNSAGDFEISVGLPETFISRVKTGDKTSIAFSAIPDRAFDGVVTEVSYAISSETSTYPVTVTLESGSGEIRPGMAADVTFTFAAGEGERRLVAPASAVAQDQKGNYVFIVEAAEGGFGFVRRREVTVGKLTGEGFVIEDGLLEGDLVVTSGVNKISDGMKVRVLQ